jgi:hypothetical protein
MSVAYDPKVRTTYTDDVPRLRAAHKVLLEVPFTPSLTEAIPAARSSSTSIR